jgi:hypothetical protein
MIFTRYLYNKDEIQLTFMECLLKQEDIEECYYWFYEYYQSGYEEESWQLLYKIYYDFYYLKNPKMINKINKKHEAWKLSNDIKLVLWVVKNLFRFNKNYTIFLLRTYYKDRNLESVKSLEMAIKEKNKNAVVFYLYKSCPIEVKKSLEAKSLVKIYENYDITHQLLAIIIKGFKIYSKKKCYYKMVVEKDLLKMLKSNEKETEVRKTLTKRRLYKISHNIGCFNLDRYKVDLMDVFRYHWEYYAYKCPIWRKRFDKYKINVSDAKKLIYFEDEDEKANEYDEFYDEYNYEPDEQKKEIQDIGEIEKSSIKTWINNIFERKLVKNIRIRLTY